MPTTSRTLSLACAAALSMTTVLGCADPVQPEHVSAGRSLRPEGSDVSSVPMPVGSVYFFQNDGFRGDAIRLDNVMAMSHGALNEAGPAADRVSSVRWNLPPGVVVLLHEHAQGKGDRIAIWGQGEAASMNPWDFNDKLSRWSWHNVGGYTSAEVSMRPHDAQLLTAAMPRGVIELFQDRELKGQLTTIGPLSTFATGARHDVNTLSDRMSSLRWNLAPGVVVVFYEDAFGPGEQFSIWGQGQYNSIADFDFNDKVSRWAWYDLTGSTSADVRIVPAATVAPAHTPAPGESVIIETKTTTVRTEPAPNPR